VFKARVRSRQKNRAKESADQTRKRLKEELVRQSQDYERKLEHQRLDSERITNNNRKVHKEEIQKLKQQLSSELASKEQHHAQALAAANRHHEERRQELKTLQDRLQKRDNHVGLTDAEILNGKLDADGELEVYSLATILAEVKNLAAWSWRDSRDMWNEDVMSELAGDKQKRLKKLILGDLIWTFLYQNIFESPFRLLGDIGTKLENDWRKNFGEGMWFSSVVDTDLTLR